MGTRSSKNKRKGKKDDSQGTAPDGAPAKSPKVGSQNDKSRFRFISDNYSSYAELESALRKAGLEA